MSWRPDSPPHAEAIAALRGGDAGRAADLLRRVIASDSRNDRLHNALGVALRRLGQLSHAAEAFGRAVELNPLGAKAWRNLGAVRADLADAAGACAAYRAAVDLEPACSEAWVQLGRMLHKSARVADAIAVYDRAIELRASDPPALHAVRYYQSLALLTAGEFTRGWEGYESRLWIHSSAVQDGSGSSPRWDGGELGGRCILLDAEQGLGDTIQFVRYAALVAERGGRVLLRCQPRLRDLMRRVRGVSDVAAAGDALPPVDVQARLMSLPRLFGTRMETIPASAPYLRLSPQHVEAWRRQLAAMRGAVEGKGRSLNVGLAWAGDARHDSDRDRSASLHAMSPLATAPGVRLFNLQRGPPAAQLRALPPSIRITDIPDANERMEETAAFVASLDLVVTVDTSIAHLAGAIGQRVWTALAHAADWRWMLDREDSPWYPTMRLFRQERPGDWEGEFARMAKELAGMLGGRR